MAKAPPSRASRRAFSGLLQPGRDAEALVRSNRLAALGTLVAGVAHEINNPITYVIGNLEELERLSGAMREALGLYRRRLVEALGPEGGAEADAFDAKVEEAGGLGVLEELLADASEGAARIRGLARDLLVLAHPGEATRGAVDVHELLDSTLRLAGQKLAPVARLEREYAATRPAFGDRARLGQVFLNLISNAIDACQPPDPAKHALHVRTADCAAGVVVEVEDSGVGVPAALAPQIFRPFFTTKELGAGTGLGLYITRRIVEQHGGTLEVSSVPGRGARFSVQLPAHEPPG